MQCWGDFQREQETLRASSLHGLVSLAWCGVVCGVVWCGVVLVGLLYGLSVRYNLLLLGLQDRRWTGSAGLRSGYF